MIMKKLNLIGVVILIFSAFSFAQEKQLTIDDIFHPQKRVAFSGKPTFGVRWSSDGNSFIEPRSDDKSTKIVNVNTKTGEEVVVYNSAEVYEALAKLGVPGSEADPMSRRFISQNIPENSFLISSGTDLYVFNANTRVAKRLTNDKAEELEADFSPNGKMVSFVRGNDLYVVDIATGKESRLTKDGTKNILNGYLTWVYEEELYGRGQNRGYWWAPDSTAIAFLRSDDSMVPMFVMADDTVTDQVIEDVGYPQAGDPNPIVSLHIADIGSKMVSAVDISKYKPEDFLISRVDWSPDSKNVIWQGQDRVQTYLDLNSSPKTSGKTTTLFRDKTPAWIDSPGNPTWLSDGTFVWESPRDGFKHLYHYSADGKLLKQVTKGDWEVASFYGFDDKSGYAYFSATEHEPNAPQIYRIKLDGSGFKRLTTKNGSYSAVFNPAMTHFVATWSDINTPPQTALHRADGSIEKVINANEVKVLNDYKLAKPEFFKVKNRDGFEMEAYFLKPPSFDASKKYPVLTFVYGGPHAPQVRNSWAGSRYMYHQFLAQNGYIVFVVDPRSASGKGEKETWTAYKNLGFTEQKDIEDGVSFLKSQSFVDPARIGIWGWSYGGYMTLYAMTHSKSFKMGISVAPVSNWALYDSIYTERYMLTPEMNPDGYAQNDLNSKAKDLDGKLLIVHGNMDNNVHMQNTTKFTYELQKAGIQFDMMAYPTQRHGISNPSQTYHLYKMMADFVFKNL